MLQSRSPKCTQASGTGARDLHFDMARARDQQFQVHIAIAERGQCFRLAQRMGLRQLVWIRDGAHTPPAAAPQRLDHHGRPIAQRGGEGLGFFKAGRSVGPRQNRDTRALGQGPGCTLVAKQV
jgi:hypothetical protein